MRIQYAAVFAVLALLAGGSSRAQDSAELFGKLDSNKDGFVTSDEVPPTVLDTPPRADHQPD